MNRRLCLLVLVVACVLCPAYSAERTELAPKDYFGSIGTTLSKMLSSHHLLRLPVDDEIAKAAWDKYLQSLDNNRVFFLEDDIKAFEKDKLLLDDMLLKGDVTFAYKVFGVLKQRVRNRAEYVKTLLDDDFDLGKDESWTWKRVDAPRAANSNEWNEIWRKSIKDQYLRRVLAAEVLEKNEEDADEKKDDGKGKKVKSPKDAITAQYDEIVEALEQAESEWVLQRYLTAFARSYDPHCSYMAPASTEDFDIGMKLSLTGIGAVLRSEDGGAVIVSIVAGGPADRDGRLKPGDKIIEVGQGDDEAVSILHWPLSKAVRIIRGEKGTTVVLTVMPASDPSGSTTKKIEIVRDKVKLEGRSAKGEIKDVTGSDGKVRKLGVIRIPAFYADLKAMREDSDTYKSSSRDVDKLLVDMRRKGVNGILLDIRSNGGGALLEAVSMTGLFIERGPVVQVKKTGHPTGAMYDRDPYVAYSGPLLVLVNRYSASASEILAGALQDYERAVIVGDSKTFGKGSVQGIFKLSKEKKMGTAKITTALFYRVSGSSTQLKGVSPDIRIPSLSEYAEVGEDHLDNPLEWTMKRSAGFMPDGDLGDVVETLRKKSDKRLSASEEFSAYIKLLGLYDSVRDREQLSLNIDERRKDSEHRRRLVKEIKELAKDEEEGHGSDLVLEEGLSILSDLAAITGWHEDPVDVPARRKEDVAEATREEVENLIDQLGDRSPEVRARAKKRLEEIGGDSIPFLQDRRDHEDPEVRAVIRELLGK